MPITLRPSNRRVSLRHLRAPIAACCLALAGPGAVLAGDAPSLDEVRRAARSLAPSVVAMQAREMAAREDAARAGSLPDPTLAVGLDNLTATGADAFRFGADMMTMRRVGVFQDWPSRRKRDARQAVAEAQADVARSESEITALEVERQAGDAWVAWWIATAERDILAAMRVEADRAIEISQAQLATGTGSVGDALSARLARAELENEMRRVEAQNESARVSLSRWIDLAKDAEVAGPPDFSRLPVQPQYLRESLDQHAALGRWDSRALVAERAVDLARARKRPDLGFGAAYGARSAGRPDMLMFEMRIGLPLFPGNRQNRDIAARVAEREAIAAQHEDARRAQRESLERQLAQWRSLRDENARYLSALLPLAGDRSAVELAAYGSGGEIRAWIEARREELALRRRHLQVQAGLARAWIALDTLLPRDSSERENAR